MLNDVLPISENHLVSMLQQLPLLQTEIIVKIII